MSGSAPEHDQLGELILRQIKREVAALMRGIVTNDGKLALRTAPIQGPLRTGGGGTGTTWGFADHGHTGADDGQKLAEANTHQVLNANPATAIHWSIEMMQDMISSFLVDGLGAAFVYDDIGGKLAIPSNGNETFGIVFTNEGAVALTGDGSIVTKTY